MRLNGLSPSPGSKRRPKRVGRGIGSGTGKTGGRGHKGQNSRTSGGVAPGFEGGQMPLHRRLPKFGFISRKARLRDEVRLDALADLDAEVVTLETLKQAGLVDSGVRSVKVIASGSLERPVVLQGLAASRGARAAIEAAGGKVGA